MRSAAWLCVAMACTSIDAVELPRATETKTYVVARIDGPLELHAFSGAEPAVLRGTTLRVLEYAKTLEELALTPDADGRVTVLPATAPLDDAWPLPTPLAAHDLEDGSSIAVEAGELERWLASFLLPRPHCKHKPTRRLLDWARNPNLSMAVPLGNGVLLGTRPSEGLSYLWWSGDGDPIPVSSPHLGTPGTHHNPLTLRGLSEREGHATILWPSTSTTPGYTIHTITATLGVSAGVTLRHPLEPSLLRINALARSSSGVLVARVDDGELLEHEPSRDWWRLAVSAPSGPCTDGGVTSLILDFIAPRQLLFARKQVGDIVIVDLDRPANDPIVPGRPLVDPPSCTNGRAVLEGDAEVVVFRTPERGFAGTAAIAWRVGAGPFRIVDTPYLSGRALWGRGDLILAGGSFNAVVHLELDRSRPELPPRKCGEIAALTDSALYFAPFGEGSLFVGSGAGTIVLDEVP